MTACFSFSDLRLCRARPYVYSRYLERPAGHGVTMASLHATKTITPRRRAWDGVSLLPGSRGRRLAVGLAAVTIALSWLLSDVTAWEAMRFLAFEACYSLLPGCLLYLALSRAPGGLLRTVAIGWPCGYALELGAFALTADLHARAAFAFLPLLALLALGPVAYRRAARALERRRAHSRQQDGGYDWLVVAGAFSAALVLLAFTFFAPYPLPAHARSVSYSEDNVFDISIAADARHHWPITEPWVAGQPLHYYTGVFMHMAAINQVTGVPLATIVLRLLPTIMLLVAALQLWSLGRSLGRSRWIGPLAVVLALVVEDVNLDATHTELFHIDPFNQFSLSPSFAFGVPFFLGALELVQSRLLGEREQGDRGTGAWGPLVMLAILALGCAATKAFAAADLIAGVGLFWLWRALAGQAARLLSIGLAVIVAGALVVYLGLLTGGMAATLSVHPFDFLTSGATFVHVKSTLQSATGHSGLWIVPVIAGAPVIAAILFAPLLGALWLIRDWRRLPPLAGLLLSMFTVGALGYVLLGAPGGVEGVFLVYGYIALAPAAAMGLVGLWSDMPAHTRRELARASAALLAWSVAMAALAQVTTLTGVAHAAWYVLAYGPLAGTIVLVVLRHARDFAPTIAWWPGRAAACCIPLLGVMGLVKPITLAGVGAWKTALHEQIAPTDSRQSYGMTSPLYAGLLWVRGHTSPCDVLAVSNHRKSAYSTSSLYFYYSAFAERRVYLESWLYSPLGTILAQPYPARYRLNTEAVADGSPAALRRLAATGVSYVLVDKTHGGGAPEPAEVSRLVFANRALDVYRLLGAPGGRAAERGCGTVGA